MSTEKKNMVVLESSDGEIFKVEETWIIQSETIKHMIEDGCGKDPIPLFNVTADILSKVLEYCEKHAASGEKAEEELKAWDADFVGAFDMDTLYFIILAANYLDIKGLLELCCERVAKMIKGKMPEQIRELFKIENDFSPEEEEAIRKENQWAFEYSDRNV